MLENQLPAATAQVVNAACSPSECHSCTQHWLSDAGREFTVHSPVNVKGNHQQALACAPDLTRLLQSWRLLFGLWIKAVETIASACESEN